MDDPQNFSGNAADLAALAIERGRAYGLPVDPDKTNERLVRYYVAEGVVDRPDRVGRDAAYGYRHLLQLLTARRMAQAGMSLAVIAEHNRSALTRALEEGLDKPLPTQAELLVGSFIHRKHSAPRAASTAVPTQAPPPRPSMALPDVLDEVRSFKADVIGQLQSMGEQEAASMAALHAMVAESMASFAHAHQTELTQGVHAMITALEDRVTQRLAKIQAQQAQDTERLLALLKTLQPATPPPPPAPAKAHTAARTAAPPAA